MAPLLVAKNVLSHEGCGGLNIDGCRVPFASDEYKASAFPGGRLTAGNLAGYKEGIERKDFTSERNDVGRFPANVIHDGSDAVLEGFPDSNGSGPARVLKRGKRDDVWGMQDAPGNLSDAGSGSASRFFYCAKASKSDRDKGLEGMPEVLVCRYGEMGQGPKPQQTPSVAVRQRNTHPTVKPTSLMRYLCRLVTPPDGICVDPFMGSGSTGVAAVLEGFRFIGVDAVEEYHAIADRRCRQAEDDWAAALWNF